MKIYTNNVALVENTVYKLHERKGSAFGSYEVVEHTTFNTFNTGGDFNGELKITRFDNDKQIISGTFWFDAVNEKGEKVEVREGRFDMQFTK